jgi:hypothetical protein
MHAPDGTTLWNVPLPAGGGWPYGTIVDSNGDVWTVSLFDWTMTKFAGSDGTALAVVPTGRDPYTYSDATGLGLRTSFPTGTWTVVFDGLSPDLDWLGAFILWSSDEPQDTSVTVRVRSSNDQITWSNWEDVSNGAGLTATPPGRYLQIEVSLRISAGEVSPVLYDLTVIPACADAPTND